MTTEQITLHLCEVIAQQKQKINQLESSNKYLRGLNDDYVEGFTQSEKEKKELEAALKTCYETIDVKNDLILACDKLLAEQKETIETLQSSIKSMDMEYGKLVEKYNALNPANNGSN
jgi:chromosome segregation ATPase